MSVLALLQVSRFSRSMRTYDLYREALLDSARTMILVEVFPKIFFIKPVVVQVGNLF